MWQNALVKAENTNFRIKLALGCFVNISGKARLDTHFRSIFIPFFFLLTHGMFCL